MITHSDCVCALTIALVLQGARVVDPSQARSTRMLLFDNDFEEWIEPNCL
eukprot:SAG31_NODE_10757_length_1101_cov_1.775449_3_plen_49_part_01